MTAPNFAESVQAAGQCAARRECHKGVPAWRKQQESPGSLLFIGTVYFALVEKEKWSSRVMINEDFANEKQISPIVIRQMEAGALDATELSEQLQFMPGKKDIIPLRMLANIIAATDGAKSIETRKRGFMSLYASE